MKRKANSKCRELGTESWYAGIWPMKVGEYRVEYRESRVKRERFYTRFLFSFHTGGKRVRESECLTMGERAERILQSRQMLVQQQQDASVGRQSRLSQVRGTVVTNNRVGIVLSRSERLTNLLRQRGLLDRVEGVSAEEHNKQVEKSDTWLFSKHGLECVPVCRVFSVGKVSDMGRLEEVLPWSCRCVKNEWGVSYVVNTLSTERMGVASRFGFAFQILVVGNWWSDNVVRTILWRHWEETMYK